MEKTIALGDMVTLAFGHSIILGCIVDARITSRTKTSYDILVPIPIVDVGGLESYTKIENVNETFVIPIK